ncbi:MAG: response regulator transcription factor [Alphaproteobacteria bacterium]|nr:response regulator transcription factor [Alphaproteobacteria bacterium]
MNKIRLLIVDDDPGVSKLLATYLGREGYAPEIADSVAAMQASFEKSPPELVILDVMLPDGDGWGALRWIRERSQLPVMMLTGKGDTIDKIVGLEMGADDYLAKPFEMRELLARLRTIQRRRVYADQQIQQAQPAAAAAETKFRFHGLEIDVVAHEVRDPNGAEIKLTMAEFRLLSILARNAGKVVPRDQLSEDVAGRDWDPNDRSIDVHLSNLRKKIDGAANRAGIIRTVRGTGYMLIPPSV